MSAARGAVDRGDVAELERLLAEDRSEVDELIHYVCDKVFDGTLSADASAQLAWAIVAAGADPDHRDGDPLNAAASLGAIGVAVVLLDAGARADLTGAFGETALHWAAFIGSDELVARLLEAGAPVDLRDARWNATPLEWAQHGLKKSPVPADQGRHREVISRLTAAARCR